MANGSQKNYMTPSGAQKLREELDSLMKEIRPKLVETISWAASNGDRSENGDYLYGKRKLREIDRRIHYLNKQLDDLVIVDPTSQSSDRILFGATVSVLDEQNIEKTYQIVGIDEIDPSVGKISWQSPIAKSLLHARVGDSITLKTPNGELDLEVLRIAYIPIV